jgi:hypothetical protein
VDRKRFLETLGETCVKTDLPREIGVSTPSQGLAGFYLTG